jgi:hypothetical protein
MGVKLYDDTGLLRTGTGGSGETNTASNIGTDGVGVWDQKIGSDLQFRNVASVDPELLLIALDAGDNDIDLTVLGSPTIQQDMIKNSPGTINLGEVVYAANYGTMPQIELADADNSSAMPAAGIAAETITNLVAGKVISFGIVTANTTGESVGASVYVDTTPGAWTTTRPTGVTAQVQKIGWIAEVGASGKIFVVGAGRSNDVPNLEDAKFWLGNASNVATAVSMSLDATMANTGAVTIADDAVTYAKMQNVVADNVFLGNNSGAGAIVDELTGTEATALLDVFTSGLKGLAPASGGGTTNFLRADGSWAAPPGGGVHTLLDNATHTDTVTQTVSRGSIVYGNATPAWDELVVGTGVLKADGTDVTGWATIVTADIGDNQVTYAKMQDVSATSRFLGRITAGAGDTEELTGTQATTLLDVFTSGLKGLAPASGGGTTNFLRADGTWAAPPGGGTHTLLDNATHTDTVTQTVTRGSIVYGNATPAWDELVDVSWGQIVEADITNDAVTNAKMANMAANSIKANATVAPADPTDFAVGTNTVVGRVAGNIVAAQLVTGQITDSNITYAKIQNVGAQSILANATGAPAALAELAVGTNTVVGRVAGNVVAAQLVTGQITDDNVTYAKIQNVAANSVFLGNDTAPGSIIQELTGTEATVLLDVFTSGLKGLAPASGGGTTNFLRADGTWAAPPGGGAHNLLDNGTHTDTVTQTVTRGSLVYGNATPAWDELVVGSANDILGTDGTDVAWVTATGTGNAVRANAPTFGGDYITVSTKADPDPTGADGRLFYNTSDTELKYAKSTAWKIVANLEDSQTFSGNKIFTGTLQSNGTVNFLNASSVRLARDLTLTADGQITIDSTQDQFIYREGSTDNVLMPFRLCGIPALSPTTGDEAIMLMTDFAITINRVRTSGRGGGTVAYEIRQDTDADNAGTLIEGNTDTADGTIDTHDTITAGSVPADRVIWIEYDTVTGTVDDWTLQFRYTVDRV